MAPTETTYRDGGKSTAPSRPDDTPRLARSSSLHATDEWAEVDMDVAMEEFWTRQSGGAGNVFHMHGHPRPNTTSTPNDNPPRMSVNPWATLTPATEPQNALGRSEQPSVRQAGQTIVTTTEPQRPAAGQGAPADVASTPYATTYHLHPTAGPDQDRMDVDTPLMPTSAHVDTPYPHPQSHAPIHPCPPPDTSRSAAQPPCCRHAPPAPGRCGRAWCLRGNQRRAPDRRLTPQYSTNHAA